MCLRLALLCLAFYFAKIHNKTDILSVISVKCCFSPRCCPGCCIRPVAVAPALQADGLPVSVHPASRSDAFCLPVRCILPPGLFRQGSRCGSAPLCLKPLLSPYKASLDLPGGDDGKKWLGRGERGAEWHGSAGKGRGNAEGCRKGVGEGWNRIGRGFERDWEGVGMGAGRRGRRRLGQADDVGPAGGVVGATELVFDGVGKEGGLAGRGAAGELLGAEDDGFGAVGAVNAVQGAV